MIDTHCHLTYPGLIERLDEVLAAAAAAGVDRMITIGTAPADAEKARALAERYTYIYFAAGLHPHHSQEWDENEVRASITRLAMHPKCVAIGEMGLDRHYPEPPIEDQKRMFALQLAVVEEVDAARAVSKQGEVAASHPHPARRTSPPSPSRERGKPIVIHNREATDETVAIIRDSGIAGDRFVFHCFTGSGAELDQILGLGAMVSFTGIVTFKNAGDIAACAKRVPDDRIMIETDSPYLAPEPYRKVRPNEPRYVADVARFLAKVRGMEERAFVEMVDANAERFFGLR